MIHHSFLEWNPLKNAMQPNCRLSVQNNPSFFSQEEYFPGTYWRKIKLIGGVLQFISNTLRQLAGVEKALK